MSRSENSVTVAPTFMWASSIRADARLKAGATTALENSRRQFLLAEDVGEHQRRDDGSVGLDNESRRGSFQFSPGDFFVGHCSAVGAVRRGAVRNLAEVAPQAAFLAQVLRDQGNDANRKVSRDA